jgi:NAD(P)-dependent dehydrogenase (short-subunit alcohol dehydrogenase family)
MSATISPQDSPVLVVGASGAIGAAVARAIGKMGHPLGLHYCTNRASVDSTLSAVANVARAYPLQSNLASVEQCDALVDDFLRETGRIFGIALCAGTVPWKQWQETNHEDWAKVFFEHCIAPFALARAAANRMAKEGRVVYLSSIAAKYGGSAKTLHYAAAKSSLETAMRGLARELAPKAILVNGVRAGLVDTPQQTLGRSPDELSARIARIPLGRAGKPDEIASGFSYLFSSAAGFTTGDVITVAGGD